MPKPNKILKAAAGAAVLSGGAFLAAGGAAYSLFLSRKAAARGMNAVPDGDILAGRAGASGEVRRGLMEQFIYKNAGMEEMFGGDSFPEIQESLRWHLEKNPEQASIASPNGRGRIHADVFRNEVPSGVWVVSLHGYTSGPRHCGSTTRVFYDWGWNVLLPHLGGHGRSEGRHVSMGWLDRFDVLAWIAYIVKENANAKIVLYGGSMGGAAVMMATGEPLPANVVCAVEDCGYSSFWDEYAHQAKALLHIPVFPALHAMDFYVRVLQGFSMRDASCVEQVKKSATPTLFIHGEADPVVPLWMFEKVYAAAACEKERLTIPGAGHGESERQGERYFGAVKGFVGRYV
ncbi:MAG: lysophospholipase [Oscillospiraceae bacterium]|nr:lysophospholipase [Oscillospiraceae bacterium]